MGNCRCSLLRRSGGNDMALTFCPQSVAWGDVATWLSAVASFAAAVVALYLARRSDAPRARGTLSIVFIMPDTDTKLLSFQVSNLGTHSLRVSSCFLEFRRGLRWLTPWPAAIANNWPHPRNSRLPADIQRGDSFHYMTPGDGGFGEFLAPSKVPAAIAVRCVRAGVSTPWGPIYVRMADSTRKMLIESVKAERAKPKN